VRLLFAVSRISLVKPDKARSIEDMIIGAARSGQIREKVRHAAGAPRVRHGCASNVLSPARTMPVVAAAQRRAPPRAAAKRHLLVAAAAQVSEERLIDLLEQVNDRMQQKTKVTIQRRRAFDDD
jgi:hypothetical protein